jgi:hypothetical protein
MNDVRKRKIELRVRLVLFSILFVKVIGSVKNYSQRAGIADGGEFYIRPPGTAAWFFDKVKY